MDNTKLSSTYKLPRNIALQISDRFSIQKSGHFERKKSIVPEIFGTSISFHFIPEDIVNTIHEQID